MEAYSVEVETKKMKRSFDWLSEKDRRRYATVEAAKLGQGVAREQARKDPPLSTYTEAYWKIDLHDLLHFLALRMDEHAQQEIRDYATTIGREIVRPLFPQVWQAFADYRLGGLALTRLETEIIARLVAVGHPLPASEQEFLEAQDESWRPLKRCRERDECRAKLVRLGILAEAPGVEGR